MTPRLVAVTGPRSGWTIYLDSQVTSIGRQVYNDIELEDALVSRRHCLVKREGGQYVIEDLGSMNGTFHNDERVTRGVLKEGSLIDIGTSRFIFWVSESISYGYVAGSSVEAGANYSTLEETIELSRAGKQ